MGRKRPSFHFPSRWGQADSNRRHGVPNAVGWTKLPHGPMLEHGALRHKFA